MRLAQETAAQTQHYWCIVALKNGPSIPSIINKRKLCSFCGYGETEGGSFSLFSLLASLSEILHVSSSTSVLSPLALTPFVHVLLAIEIAASHPEAKLNLWSH